MKNLSGIREQAARDVRAFGYAALLRVWGVGEKNWGNGDCSVLLMKVCDKFFSKKTIICKILFKATLKNLNISLNVNPKSPATLQPKHFWSSHSIQRLVKKKRHEGVSNTIARKLNSAAAPKPSFAERCYRFPFDSFMQG